MKFEPAEGVVFIGCTCGFIKERILGRRIADTFGDPNTTALVAFFRAGAAKECHYCDTIDGNVVVGLAFSFSAIRGSSAKILG